ncbi:MAG TPA: dephospho-CoA kinase [Anaerolineaceae bacterium]
MSKWAGKYVIGLTGNIGTGKSVVRRMLEHMGAFGIDADALSHRAISKGAPGYRPVVETFGHWVLRADGEVDRGRLGRVVFSDPAALVELEKIVHPLVGQAVDWMIQRVNKRVVAIEAIKLLESSLSKQCDSIWVVVSPVELQASRLVQRRKMSEAEAMQRIKAQPPQEQKVAAANVVIKNAASFEDTWRQVVAAWPKGIPSSEAAQAQPVKAVTLPQGDLTVVRGRPRDAEAIASLMKRVKKDGAVLSEDIMDAFGEKAFLLLRIGDRLIGVAGWQVENLVARTSEIILDPAFSAEQLMPPLIQEMERASKDLQCEAALVSAAPVLAVDKIWKALGYERRTPQSLDVSVWQEAAKEMAQPSQSLYFKQLRVDRVLRPI